MDMGGFPAAPNGLRLIASTTLGLVSSTITVPGLNLAKHGLYQVRVRLKNATAVAAHTYMTYNGDTTASNYDTEVCWGDGATFIGGRTDRSSITYLQASVGSSGVIEIMLDFDGNASAMTRIRAGTTTIRNEMFAHRWKTSANVTSLTLTNASTFAIGSSVEVWA